MCVSEFRKFNRSCTEKVVISRLDDLKRLKGTEVNLPLSILTAVENWGRKSVSLASRLADRDHGRLKDVQQNGSDLVSHVARNSRTTVWLQVGNPRYICYSMVAGTIGRYPASDTNETLGTRHSYLLIERNGNSR